MRDNCKPFVSESIKQNIRQTNEHDVFRKTHFKYLVMRVRAKISFTALEKRQTVVQLIVETINRVYYHLMEKGGLPKYTREE